MKKETVSENLAEFPREVEDFVREKHPDAVGLRFEIVRGDEFIYDDDGGYFKDVRFELLSVEFYHEDESESESRVEDIDVECVDMINCEVYEVINKDGNVYRETFTPFAVMIELDSWDEYNLALQMLTSDSTIGEIASWVEKRTGPAKARQFLDKFGDGVLVRDWAQREYPGTETEEKILALLEKN